MTEKEFDKMSKEVRTLCNFVAQQICDIAERYEQHPIKVNKFFTMMHVKISEGVEKQIKEREDDEMD